MKSALLFVLFAPTLFAQSAELTGSAGLLQVGNAPLGYQGYGSGNALLNPVRLENGPVFAMRLTLNTWNYFGHEGGVAYSRNKLTVDFNNILTIQPSRSTYQVFYDLLFYPLREDSRVRPFLAAGPQITEFRARQWLGMLGRQDTTRFGFNYGGGVKVILSQFVLLRLDFREYASLNPFPDLLGKPAFVRQREFSAGAGIRF